MSMIEEPGEGVIADIRTAADFYPVLILRNQRLTDAQLRDFAARFGPLEELGPLSIGVARRLGNLSRSHPRMASAFKRVVRAVG